MKSMSFVSRIFCEPTNEDYRISDDIAVKVDNLDWVSHHEDSKNVALDQKNLKNDMIIAIDEYSEKING